MMGVTAPLHFLSARVTMDVMTFVEAERSCNTQQTVCGAAIALDLHKCAPKVSVRPN